MILSDTVESRSAGDIDQMQWRRRVCTQRLDERIRQQLGDLLHAQAYENGVRSPGDTFVDRSIEATRQVLYAKLQDVCADAIQKPLVGLEHGLGKLRPLRRSTQKQPHDEPRHPLLVSIPRDKCFTLRFKACWIIRHSKPGIGKIDHRQNKIVPCLCKNHSPIHSVFARVCENSSGKATRFHPDGHHLRDCLKRSFAVVRRSHVSGRLPNDIKRRTPGRRPRVLAKHDCPKATD